MDHPRRQHLRNQEDHVIDECSEERKKDKVMDETFADSFPSGLLAVLAISNASSTRSCFYGKGAIWQHQTLPVGSIVKNRRRPKQSKKACRNWCIRLSPEPVPAVKKLRTS